MSDYKRLTERHESGYIGLMCRSCEYDDKCFDFTRYCKQAIKKRLAELEDKIEQGELISKEWHDEQVLHAEETIKEYQTKIESGTLIDLPCKVGDTVYYTSPEYYNSLLIEYIVNEISITREGLRLAVYGTTNEKGKTAYLWSDFIGKTVFLTKAEAEAKLRELRGGAEK
ncbi:MAG: hypothetical protein IJ301_05020 [Clostridia bacterium]|nr:hypothetical protein [Clostridia bacterium]